jgi:hypothetical protein
LILGAAGLACAAPAPNGHDQMLRQLIQDTLQDKVRYETFTPDLATAVRPQVAQARSELVALGPLKSVTFESTSPDGMEIYRTEFEKGALDWAFAVDAQGRISNAAFRPAKP